MKDFFITKNFDNLGRVVIPKEMRTHYGFHAKSSVKVIPQKEGILLVLDDEKKTNYHNRVEDLK